MRTTFQMINNRKKARNETYILFSTRRLFRLERYFQSFLQKTNSEKAEDETSRKKTFFFSWLLLKFSSQLFTSVVVHRLFFFSEVT